MTLAYSPAFEKSFKRLPEAIQRKVRAQLLLLEQDWTDSRLHRKQLQGEERTYSFRITRDYRAIIFHVEESVLLLVDIGHRKDVYR